jgi:hypothetical protein
VVVVVVVLMVENRRMSGNLRLRKILLHPHYYPQYADFQERGSRRRRTSTTTTMSVVCRK